MSKIIIKAVKSEAYDEEGNPVDCELEDLSGRKANPDGFNGVKETSKEAKRKIDLSGVSKTQREFVFSIIKQSNGICIHEISDLSGLQKSSISPRVNELAKANRIYNSGTIVYKNYKGEAWKAN